MNIRLPRQNFSWPRHPPCSWHALCLVQGDQSLIMSLPALLLVVFLVAVTTSLAVAGRLTRVIVKTRPPERSRQWSASRIPRIGGIAIFAALPVAILAAASANAALTGAIPQLPELAEALIVASAILFMVGLL